MESRRRLRVLEALALGALALWGACRLQNGTLPAGGEPTTTVGWHPTNGIRDAIAVSDGDGGPVDARSDVSDGSRGARDSSIDVCLNGCCGNPLSPCPSTLPALGTPCNPRSPACEYGDSPIPACNTLVTCSVTNVWTLLQVPQDAGISCLSAEPACPPTYASADATGLTCALDQFNDCVYPEGECLCDGGEWSCVPSPMPDNSCPATRPRAGTPCATDGGGCQLWGKSCNPSDLMDCWCGVWTFSFCL